VKSREGIELLILRAFEALLTGFLTIALLVGGVTTALRKFWPEWAGRASDGKGQTTGYLLFNLLYTIGAAILGGYITARMAAQDPLVHGMALAFIVLLFGALSALQQRGAQPIWNQLLTVAATPFGVILGVFFRMGMLPGLRL
jgi:hypothetical protein